jgi:hypothetical protein
MPYIVNDENVLMVATCTTVSKKNAIALKKPFKGEKERMAGFILRGNAQEISGLKDGAAVTPEIGPRGAVVVRGGGSILLDNGMKFQKGGAQNKDTAFLQFKGAEVGRLFGSAEGATISIQSAYDLANRPQGWSSVWEVWDGVRSIYSLHVYANHPAGNLPAALQFYWVTGGVASVYSPPMGHEDAMFGKGKVAKVNVAWNPSELVSLSINDVPVQSYVSPSHSHTDWSDSSFLIIGGRGVYGGKLGYYACLDSLSEFIVE